MSALSNLTWRKMATVSFAVLISVSGLLNALFADIICLQKSIMHMLRNDILWNLI